jgi:hypothetical protein
MKATSTKPNLIYGNITLATSPEELLITQTSDRSLDAIIFQIVFFLGALLYAGLVFRHSYLPYTSSPFHLESIPLILIASVTGMSILRPLFGQRQVLRFTPIAVEIESFDFGRCWRHQTILRQTVVNAAYGLWTCDRSREPGLRISTNSRQIDLLKGLKAVEAQTMLQELDRLGYRVWYDEDLPEWIAAEQKRRKFLEKIYD